MKNVLNYVPEIQWQKYLVPPDCVTLIQFCLKHCPCCFANLKVKLGLDLSVKCIFKESTHKKISSILHEIMVHVRFVDGA